jgi:hypothetical protein
VKSGGVFFDGDFYGDEIRGDVIGDFLVRINLGIQPSACSSSGRDAEIQQN